MVSLANVWSRTQLPLGRVSPSTLYLVSSSICPRRSAANINRYGANGQPYLIDLDNLKSSPNSPLTLTDDEASQYNEETHLIHLGLNPNLDKVGKRKPHFILSKVFSKSKRSKTRSCSLSTAHSSNSWAKKILSKMLLLIIKPIWLGLITNGRCTCIFRVKIVANILQILPRRVMGLQFPNLEWSPDFEIKVIIPLLMKSEVSPNENIA